MMRHRSSSKIRRALRLMALLPRLSAALLWAIPLAGLSLPLSTEAFAQSDQRVFWQLQFDSSLNKTQRDEAEAALMQVLSRAKERHFASDKQIEQKLKNEGLHLPACFEDGSPCATGGNFLLEVLNVDAFVQARFAKIDRNWQIDFKLHRRLSASELEIQRNGAKLQDLLNEIVSSLFDMESGIEISSTVAGVQVYMNNRLIGTTPLNTKTAVGPQSLSFKKDGYVSQTWDFTAQKGTIHQYQVDLKPEKTHLTVLTNDPQAEIWIDDQLWGHSNESQDILPGEYLIEVRSQSHHPYTQKLRIYPGNPQSIQVALLPKSEAALLVRQRGIKRYRFSATAGYHMAFQKFSLRNSSAILDGVPNYPSSASISTINWANTSFHGLTLALNYEDIYWGISLLRLDLMGSNISTHFTMSPNADASSAERSIARAGGAFFLGLYPLQVKAHHSFWIMQAEAVAGLGYAYTRLSAERSSTAPNANTNESFILSSSALSLNLDLALKCFLSEESFFMLSYGLQLDFVSRGRMPGPRHVLTLAFGMQIPLWMRDKNPQFEDDGNLNEGEFNPSEQIEKPFEDDPYQFQLPSSTQVNPNDQLDDFWQNQFNSALSPQQTKHPNWPRCRASLCLPDLNTALSLNTLEHGHV